MDLRSQPGVVGFHLYRTAFKNFVGPVERFTLQALHGVVGVEGYVRCCDDVFQIEKLAKAMPMPAQRLVREHIDPSPANSFVEQRGQERIFVDQRPPRNIYQDRRSLHACEFISTDQVMCLIVQNAVNGNKITLRQHGLQVIFFMHTS